MCFQPCQSAARAVTFIQCVRWNIFLRDILTAELNFVMISIHTTRHCLGSSLCNVLLWVVGRPADTRPSRPSSSPSMWAAPGPWTGLLGLIRPKHVGLPCSQSNPLKSPDMQWKHKKLRGAQSDTLKSFSFLNKFDWINHRDQCSGCLDLIKWVSLEKTERYF